MSLLMEALRKAEEAKRKGQEPSASQAAPETPESQGLSLVSVDSDLPEPPPGNPSPAPVPPPTPARFELEEMPDEEVPPYYPAADEEPEPEAAPAQRRRVRVAPGNRQTETQLAAASVFAAKQQAHRSPAGLKPLLITLALLVPVVGGGTYWYLQQGNSGILLNPNLPPVDYSGRTLDTVVVTPPPAQEPVPVPEPVPDAAVASSTEDSIEDSAVPEAVSETPPAPPVETAVARSVEEPVAAPSPAPAPVADRPAAAEPTPVADRPAAAEPARLQVSLNRETPSVNPTLQSAWNALQSGNLENARQLYEETLRALPNNRDALLGLAVVHTRSGRLDAARRLYAQALTLNPQDPLARTGLLQTMADGGSDIERELLSLRDAYPQLAPVHFALGNLYAARQRWSDAQSAYFDALVLANRAGDGPVSPDYAFNLAVSLEQLQQPRAALEYYRQAQALAQQHVPGFDPALLRSRLAYLEQNLP